MALEKLAKDSEAYVRISVGGNLKTPASVLEKLAQDSELRVLFSVAENPSTPESVLEKLVQNKRMLFHLNIAKNINAPGSVLEQLAEGSDADVRQEVIKNPNTPESVRKRLERELASPRESPHEDDPANQGYSGKYPLVSEEHLRLVRETSQNAVVIFPRSPHRQASLGAQKRRRPR